MKMNKCQQMIIAVFFALVLTVTSVQSIFATAAGGPAAGASNDSKLSDFGIHPGTLSPAFSPDVLDYTATVDANVTAVDVRAVPRASASGGTIASVEGARTLKPGVNTVKVTCSAPDNSFTVYTITITVGTADGSGGQTAGASGTEGQTAGMANDPDSQAAGTTNDPESQTPGVSGSETQTPDGQSGISDNTATGKQKKKKSASLIGAVAADGTVTLSGATYKLSGNFSYGSYSQDIPSAFGQGTLQIGSNSYPTLHCESNGVDLVYMENTDGKGSTGFYYYDEMQNAVERFKYTGIGDNFVIFISSARSEVPEGFQSKTLKLPSEKKVAAYRNQSAEDMKDFYLIYGINSDGSDGWYLYDNKQGTYMRYVQSVSLAENPEFEEEIEPSVSLDKYNLLNEKYTKLKNNMVKSVSCFVIGIALLIILFTAILLRGKDNDDEEDGTEKKSRERGVRKKLKKAKKQTETIPKSSLAAGRQLGGKAAKGETKKITKTITNAQPNEPEYKQQAQAREHMHEPGFMQQAGAAGKEVETQVQRKRELDVRPQTSRVQATPRIQSDYVQQPVTPPVMPQKDLQQPARQQSAARRGLLRKEESGSEDSVKIAAEKMRQSVRRPVGSQTMAQNAERIAQTERLDEEGTGSKSRMPQRRRRSTLDDDMDIMDLNDL